MKLRGKDEPMFFMFLHIYARSVKNSLIHAIGSACSDARSPVTGHLDVGPVPSQPPPIGGPMWRLSQLSQAGNIRHTDVTRNVQECRRA
jgi:hypothetical protein